MPIPFSATPYPSTDQDALLNYDGIDQRICSGEREIERLSAHFDVLGVHRALVVCGPNVLSNSDVVDRVEEQLGDRVVGRFSGIRPHAPLDVLMAAREVSRRTRPDAVISVGGGSTMAIAKGLALLDATDEPIESFVMRRSPADASLVAQSFPTIRMKVISVPTTIGCAEFGRHVGGFTTLDGARKITITGDGQTGPHVIVIDGLALATTPTAIQRATTMGQLRLAVETFSSTLHNPYSDALTVHAMRLLSTEIRLGWIQSPTTLLRIKSAAALASMGLVATSSMGAASALAHQLGALCGVPHGEANAVTLGPVVRWNAAALGLRLGVLADAVGVDANGRSAEDVGQELCELFTSFNLALEVPSRLRDLVSDRSLLPAVAAAAARSPVVQTNPRHVGSEAELLQLLESMW